MPEQYYAGDVPFRRHPLQILHFSPAKNRLISAAAGVITTFDIKNGQVVARFAAPRVGSQVQDAVQTEKLNISAEGEQADKDTGEYAVVGNIMH